MQLELVGSLLLVLALAVVIALFIGRPFLQRTTSGAASAGEEDEREHRRSSLLAERDRVLTALQDLDFDYALGKVPAEDYPQQRAVLLKHGTDVLRRLDEIAAQMDASGEEAKRPSEAALRTAEERIEAAVAARRADASRRHVVGTGDGAPEPELVQVRANGKSKDELEEMIASRKRERKESAAGFCPRCGKPVSKSDKFCSRCGATL